MSHDVIFHIISSSDSEQSHGYIAKNINRGKNDAAIPLQRKLLTMKKNEAVMHNCCVM